MRFLYSFLRPSFSAAFVFIVLAAWLTQPYLEVWAYMAIFIPLYLAESVGSTWALRRGASSVRLDSSSSKRAA